jgi:hypothetical protein
MTKTKGQPDQPTPDDSEPSQKKAQGADGVTPDDSAPPQNADGDDG